jgi:hypothetical protein
VAWICLVTARTQRVNLLIGGGAIIDGGVSRPPSPGTWPQERGPFVPGYTGAPAVAGYSISGAP